METPLLIALLSLVSGFIGILAGFTGRRLLFKEKLQEIVYKERFAAVKELTEVLWKLESELFAGMKVGIKPNKLGHKASQFAILVRSKRAFLPDKVLKLFNDAAFQFEAVCEQEDIGLAIEKSGVLKTTEEELFSVIRKEFGIEPLTETTKKHFKDRFPVVNNFFKRILENRKIKNSVEKTNPEAK